MQVFRTMRGGRLAAGMVRVVGGLLLVIIVLVVRTLFRAVRDQIRASACKPSFTSAAQSQSKQEQHTRRTNTGDSLDRRTAIEDADWHNVK